VKLGHKLAILVMLVVAACCGLPTLWFTAPKRQYPVGANIRQLGLEHEELRWSSIGREPIQSFLTRTQTRAAHFTGSIELARPGSKFDGFQIQIIDGKPVNAEPYGDEALKADLERLRGAHLGKMLESTQNDWRIVNHNNHFVQPTGSFTGEIIVDQGSNVFLANEAVLSVKNDIIVSVSRRIYPLPD
jgi:hypothetical protein